MRRRASVLSPKYCCLATERLAANRFYLTIRALGDAVDDI
jgi:hypothetical protein